MHHETALVRKCGPKIFASLSSVTDRHLVAVATDVDTDIEIYVVFDIRASPPGRSLKCLHDVCILHTHRIEGTMVKMP